MLQTKLAPREEKIYFPNRLIAFCNTFVKI